MRPKVQALISKLRTMPTVQEPGAAEEIIWDLAWAQLYQKKQEARLAKIAARLVSLWVSMRGNEDLGVPVPEEPVAAGDRPVEGPVVNLKELLSRKDIKAGIEHVIDQHTYHATSLICECQKEMSWEEWYSHLRVRISHYLLNEFPPIGSGDAVS